MLYEYICTSCGYEMEARRRIAERYHGPQCEKCGGETEKQIRSPSMNLWPEWDVNYKCVATGQVITSMKQRREIMIANDLVDAAEFGEPDWDRMKQESVDVRASAEDPEIPAELKEAMVRENIELGYTDNT